MAAQYQPAHAQSTAVTAETAPAVDENAGHLAGGGIAAHHDADVAARLKDRIEDLGGRAPAPPGYLGESAILH
jgi:hypothetical protein